MTMVTMGPVGLMKLTRKQKLFTTIGFFLEFFSQLILTPGSVKKSFGGWWGGLSKCSVYSWPSFVKVKTRFGQVSN